MMRRYWIACGMMLVLSASAVTRADDTTEYTDRFQNCSVKAGTDWQRMPEVEKTRKTNAMTLQYVSGDKNDLAPNFMIIEIDTKDSIDASARGFVKVGKEKVPDQGDYGKITESKLDGEDARTVITKTIINNHPAIRKDIIAKHNGKTYVVAFFSSDDTYAKQIDAADTVAATFHWK